MQEFKVGDRFSVEGVVTALADREGDYRALFDGHDSDGYVLGAEMAHATLIEPERKPRYDWSNIPLEYDWAATDKNGTVYAYTNKPVTNVEGEYWYDGKGSAKHIRPGSFTADWRDSLEQRPDVAPEHDIEAHTHITPCKGKNCGSTTGMNHSPECEAEHIAAITGAVVENNVLDLSKPIRRKGETFGGAYIGRRANGKIVFESPCVMPSSLDFDYDRELENIPEPKITTSDVLSLWEFKTGGRAFLWGDAAGCATRLSRVRVSYTEGEGWSVEEMK